MSYSLDLHQSGFADPIRLTLVIWVFVVLGAYTTAVNPLGIDILLTILLAVLSHVGGMLTSRSFGQRSLRRSLQRELPITINASQEHKLKRRMYAMDAMTFFLVCIQIIAILYFLNAYREVVPSLNTSGFLAARAAYLDAVRGTGNRLLIYTTHFTLFGIGIIFFAIRQRARLRFYGFSEHAFLMHSAAISTFIMSVLTTGRTAPLLTIIAISYFSMRFGIYSIKKVMASFGILSASMFFSIAMALGKEGMGDVTQGGFFDSLIRIANVYFFSAPAALEQVIFHGTVVSNGCSNIFSYPIQLANKLGFFEECGVRKLNFVFVPVPTNVFTFIRAYWEDFGWAFPLALFVTGFLIDRVYRASLKNESFASFIYPFVLNSLLLQIFEEQLFANGSIFFYLSITYFFLAWAYRLTLTKHPTLNFQRYPAHRHKSGRVTI